ncbi:uncharacterized protein LOC132558934 [Ylistrum balloti]|uniref:uncharacterized protein LOC132558934 n=1 Tax=Ylistrum balloti TaxID=509963 RepID=UPI002905BEF0|nr:uncharacterized protein LOC132558934 [Ylistrum balloti]
MGKCTCTVCSVFSFMISATIICGGTTVCILIEYVSQGPLFQDRSIKALIVLFSAASFMSTGFVGLLGLIHNDSAWVTNLQLSIESVMLIATITAFLALKDTVYLPGYNECVATNVTSICTCSKRSKVQLPGSLSTIDCDTLNTARDMANALIYLYIAVCIMCIIELLRAIYRVCTRSSRRKESQNEEMLNSLTFYNIPYPEKTHKNKKNNEDRRDEDKEKIFTLLNT